MTATISLATARRFAKEAEDHQISPHTSDGMLDVIRGAFFVLYYSPAGAAQKEDRRLARRLRQELKLTAMAKRGRTANLGYIIGE